MRWQRRVRLAVAIFGIAVAIFVYSTMGDRQSAAPAARPVRFDPAAIIESAGTAFQQLREARQDYVIRADRQLTYAGGATRFIGITVEVRGREGRDFEVSGDEATAGENQRELEITGNVRMTASDGLVVLTDRATFSESDATVRVPGAVTFEKAGLTGAGVGMTYDQENDILRLTEQAQVRYAGGEDIASTEFTARSATLARAENYLALDGDVHALRGGQVIDADTAVARLTENEEYITFIELRGNARVAGGGAFDAMSARDIDLDYTDDGETLERVVLTGGGAVALDGANGAAGRQFAGEMLNLAFAPDATVTEATGRGGVRVDLPAAAASPARGITAEAFDATGQPGVGLDAVRFTGEVVFREEAQRGRTARVATADALSLSLDEDAVTAATFTGRVQFEEDGLRASAAQAQYDPAGGSLLLTAADEGGGPRVADDQIAIEATVIALTLEGRRMTATGTVRTTLTGQRAGGGRVPGLLEQGQPVNVNADELEYDGGASRAVYQGGAALWQGATAIRGDTITIDRNTGNLTAAGTAARPAQSTLALEGGESISRAVTITYDDADRRITYESPAAPRGSPVPATPSQVSGPQGDLRAARIEVLLEPAAAALNRLEAYTNVSARIDARTATGIRLTYFADDGRYELRGEPTAPARVVEACRETTGSTVTFFRETERLIVDGNDETRTESRRGGPCPPATPAR